LGATGAIVRAATGAAFGFTAALDAAKPDAAGFLTAAGGAGGFSTAGFFLSSLIFGMALLAS